MQQQGRIDIQAVTLSEAFSQIARHERPKTSVPSGGVPQPISRVGANVPPLHHLAQKSLINQNDAVRILEIAGFDHAIIFGLKAL
jgi:hypothetical protein